MVIVTAMVDHEKFYIGKQQFQLLVSHCNSELVHKYLYHAHLFHNHQQLDKLVAVLIYRSKGLREKFMAYYGNE